MSSEEMTAAETGAGGTYRELTDPRAMRALAHPVRLALIELLGHVGTLTATQASDLLGESPANCAFHLRTLAKYGYVEEAGGGRGRERPWRRIHAGLRIPDQHGSPQAAQAAGVLRDFLTETLLERARSSLAQQSSWPAEWQAALEQGDYVSYMTTDEARQLTADLHEVLTRHSDRVDHPERRPAGAMPIEILAIAYPLLRLGQIATGERS
jgi:DNA-binding transcriptional ArsR family regulator